MTRPSLNNNNNNNNNTRTILLSQSDFQLDGPLAFGKRYETIFPKKYDFVYSGTDQNVLQGCRGWASFAKNWTFMLEALEVMCSPEFNLTGVLIANKDKSGNVACWIPESCRDKVVQTTFLPNQTELYEYTVQSHFMMVPNVYGMSQFADGGLMSTKPYISSSNYIKKMSDYPSGDWQKVWDGLFWRFMDKNRSFFSKNPRLRMLVNNLDKMDTEKRNHHFENAATFLNSLGSSSKSEQLSLL